MKNLKPNDKNGEKKGNFCHNFSKKLLGSSRKVPKIDGNSLKNQTDRNIYVNLMGVHGCPILTTRVDNVNGIDIAHLRNE